MYKATLLHIYIATEPLAFEKVDIPGTGSGVHTLNLRHVVLSSLSHWHNLFKVRITQPEPIDPALCEGL